MSYNYFKLSGYRSNIVSLFTFYSMYAGKNAVEACLYKPAPYLFNKLNQMVDNLDGILRALEKYLETKRQLFPRFYFISNDDLLEILGNSKKPQLIQVHLKKLFDNVNKIRIDKVMF